MIPPKMPHPSKAHNICGQQGNRRRKFQTKCPPVRPDCWASKFHAWDDFRLRAWGRSKSSSSYHLSLRGWSPSWRGRCYTLWSKTMVNQSYIFSHPSLPNKCELKGMATSRAERTSQKLLCQMSDLRRRWLERSLTFRSLVHTFSYHKSGIEISSLFFCSHLWVLM